MRKIEIDAGHRLLNHEGKCKHLHGHRYSFHVYFSCPELDSIGRVIDFSEIKNKVGGWVEANWDHGMILNENDPLVKWFSQSEIWISNLRAEEDHESALIESPFFKHKYFCLPCNPSAENLASYLLKIANELMIGTGVTVFRVDCWETPNCMATAEL